ncbi:MAG: hypothetical protein KDD82_14315 [Planctomycetes bacterium]|nr:hypothetical protein [Planctomycetota bacterium]
MKAPPGYLTRGSGRDQVWLRADAEAFLARSGLDGVAAALALPGERRGRVKSLVVLPDEGAGRVFVKRWHFNRLEVAARATLKLNYPTFSGLRELWNLVALAAQGFRVPEPLAAGRALRGLRCESFVALRELPGVSLGAGVPVTRTLPRALGVLVRRLHAAGFVHRDLYLDNLFLDPELGLGLLDCERVFLCAGTPRRRWRVKDLAALQASAGPAWSRTDRLRVLRAYCKLPRLDPAAKRLARDVARKARRLTAHGAKGPTAS